MSKNDQRIFDAASVLIFEEGGSDLNPEFLRGIVELTASLTGVDAYDVAMWLNVDHEDLELEAITL